MSGPTKGMVAGKPIKTGDASKEFDEGFDRTFGARVRTRGRFTYTQDGQPLAEPVQVGEDFTGAERRAQNSTEELVYGNTKALDGTPINTRKRHREYLQRNGLAMASDYSPEYQEREAKSKELKDDKQRRETVERAIYAPHTLRNK